LEPAVRHLNYNHLLYFWTVVREGSVAAAAAALHVTPQTISGQIKLLEEQLGGALFEKQGRRLVTTDLGKLAQGYAEEIFTRGLELASVLRGALPQGRRSVTIGVPDAVPKLVAYRVLAPLLAAEEPFRVVCHEGQLDTLLADLVAHRLDLVLSASPVAPGTHLRAFSHLLGESDLAFFATSPLAEVLRPGFPKSLDQAPFFLPSERSMTRRVLDVWFDKHGITPRIVGEFDDSALIKTFGQHGGGVFVSPAAIEHDLTGDSRVAMIGRTHDLRARFYAISTERRIKHPAVAVITEAARSDLFSAPESPRRPARPA